MSEALTISPELFSVAEIETLTAQDVAAACARNYDLSRTDRRIVDAVAAMRAAGDSYRRIKAVLRVGDHLIQAVERHHPALVATEKERLARTMRIASGMATEKFAEAVAEGRTKPMESVVGAGILAQRAAELMGEASVIIEHRRAETADDYLARLRRVEGSVEVSSSVHNGLSEAFEADAVVGAGDGVAGDRPAVIGGLADRAGIEAGRARRDGQEGAGGGVAEAAGGCMDDGKGRTN